MSIKKEDDFSYIIKWAKNFVDQKNSDYMCNGKEISTGKFLSPLLLPWDNEDQRIHFSGWHFYPEKYTPELFETLKVSFPTSLQGAAKKRLAEYLAGRYSAKAALEELGVICYELKTGLNREPIWPNGIRGSITHTDNLAICAVMPAINSCYMGIDLENYLTPTAAHEIQSIIIKPDEEKYLRGTGLDFEKALTLAFSIRESVFKALHPYVQRYFDFDSVVINNLDFETRIIHMTLTQTLSQKFQRGEQLRGRFVLLENRVFTWVVR